MVTKRQKLSVDFSVYCDGKIEKIAFIPLETNANESLNLAMRWRYVVGQRHRWSRSGDLLEGIQSLASDTCHAWGINNRQLQRLAKAPNSNLNDDQEQFLASIIEVSIPYSSEKNSCWARIMPWEYLISAATKAFRSSTKKQVVRRLVTPNSRSASRKSLVPTSVAVLEAAPGPFREQYDFEGENQMVRGALSGLKILDLHGDISADPDLATLAKWVQTKRPSILHVTGIDNKLGSEILRQSPSDKDGLFLNKKGVGVEVIDAETFASTLFQTPSSTKDSSSKDLNAPHLVAFNVWHSGSRLASMAVAHGCKAAIGFENSFDDNVAERFFSRFYQQYAASHWNLAKAFSEAFKAIEALSEMTRGSSIILWTRESLLKNLSIEQREALSKKDVQICVADPDVHQVRDFLRIEVEPEPRLNYADLHNRGSLFKKLKLALYNSGDSTQSHERDSSIVNVNSIRDIDIEVNLSAAGESFPFRTSLDLVPSENIVDLADEGLQATDNHGAGGIFVPLTSSLMRSVDESIVTSVHVAIRWKNQSLYNRTFPIQLAPVDEWRFEEDQIVWMSSFVYPRDLAVAKVIEAAQRYLGCLTDDYTSGFGGYQAFDPGASDPWRGVDLQVRAIWTAISLDFGLGYINPPPSYSENAQRLRSPTRILQEGRGTCVDLALLMAACLEWVEIYPVIFNLNDHAFPGYWRNPEDYEKFQLVSMGKNVEQDEEEDGKLKRSSSLGSKRWQPPAWCSPKEAYSEIRSYIVPNRFEGRGPRKRELIPSLIPMESVFLTQRSGFQAAVEEGRSYFQKASSRDFHSMIDVPRSRSKVTPIPLSVYRDNGQGGSQ